jgi:hypothetical protein
MPASRIGSDWAIFEPPSLCGGHGSHSIRNASHWRYDLVCFAEWAILRFDFRGIGSRSILREEAAGRRAIWNRRMSVSPSMASRSGTSINDAAGSPASNFEVRWFHRFTFEEDMGQEVNRETGSEWAKSRWRRLVFKSSKRLSIRIIGRKVLVDIR